MASPTCSFKKAAERILRDADRPLSPQEIVERALETGLIETEGLSSPDPLHAVAVEGLVSADDGKTFDQGLRDDQTVEGIAVVKGHDCHLADVGDVASNEPQEGVRIEQDLHGT